MNQTAVNNIFGVCGKYDEAMYPDLNIILGKINSKKSFLRPDIRTKASNLLKTLKYETILIAHIFIKIFSITGLLLKYLHTWGSDILKCIQMVEIFIIELKKINTVWNLQRLCVMNLFLKLIIQY